MRQRSKMPFLHGCQRLQTILYQNQDVRIFLEGFFQLIAPAGIVLDGLRIPLRAALCQNVTTSARSVAVRKSKDLSSQMKNNRADRDNLGRSNSTGLS